MLKVSIISLTFNSHYEYPVRSLEYSPRLFKSMFMCVYTSMYMYICIYVIYSNTNATVPFQKRTGSSYNTVCTTFPFFYVTFSVAVHALLSGV